MAVHGTTLASQRSQAWLRPFLLTTGFGGAIAVRIAIGGVAVRQSAAAGLAFAAVLACLTSMYPPRTNPGRRTLGYGILGALCLVVPILILRLPLVNSAMGGGYLAWAAVVSLVALAEEAFLRGTLFDALSRSFGSVTTTIICAALFALLHLPLYGIAAVPLDFIVGLWLGYLRLRSGSWLAPGIAHTLTDLVSWWLR
ncbi:MAG TPA: CPBP family intramembrane glutamic endopeptidase [Candidatus Saccharimonadales bacterium]|nr:CPBP family intramembrane glutamic endopeptidase [Candidatus Saccharimonadales bacterium]